MAYDLDRIQDIYSSMRHCYLSGSRGGRTFTSLNELMTKI